MSEDNLAMALGLATVILLLVVIPACLWINDKRNAILCQRIKQSSELIDLKVELSDLRGKLSRVQAKIEGIVKEKEHYRGELFKANALISAVKNTLLEGRPTTVEDENYD